MEKFGNSFLRKFFFPQQLLVKKVHAQEKMNIFVCKTIILACVVVINVIFRAVDCCGCYC